MKTNNWWIRDLSRYIIAILCSVSIIPYMIWSFLALFLGHPATEINKNSLSELMVEYIDYGKDEFSDMREYKPDNVLTMNNNTADYLIQYHDEQNNNLNNISNDLSQNENNNVDEDIIDQFLQDEKTSNSQEVDIQEAESNDGTTWWNPFDIEKIISDLHLQKEKRVAVVAKNLWVDWNNEKLDYARLAWIQWEYNWSLEQNQKIRDYLIANAQGIYKDKHWWNEWDTLPLVANKEEKNVKMNTKEITWQVTYNDVTLKVSAPAESFPEWTVLKIKTLGDEDSLTTFDITLKEVILMAQVDKVEYDAPMASFDISFYAPDDTEFLTELQPAEWKSVSVTFDYANNKEFKQPEEEWFLAIYHMEDNDETSVANLVSVKNPEESVQNTKSDSMSIYANTLSVYILTIVSDLDEEASENSKTVTFDAGYGGFIVTNDDIILSSTWANIDSTYTWKILAKDNTITLPEVKVVSWHTFWWWYNRNTFVWNAWTIFKLWDSNNSESEQSDSDIENDSNSYEIYACLYTEWISWNICRLNDGDASDLTILESSVEEEVDAPNAKAYTPSDEEIEKYGEDVFIAYNWAINNWITTIDDVSKVKFNKKITRAELAKMMVVFMSWVLEKEPVITGDVDYRDVDSQKLGDLAWYIQLAYQYQIMWINADGTPIEDFNPEKNVTRAEFATVLSRVLFGDTYNQAGKNYYEKHIEALEKANILSNTNPDLVEARWWIMTMLYNTQS